MISLLGCFSPSSTCETGASFYANSCINVRISIVFYLPLCSSSTRTLWVAILLQSLLLFLPLSNQIRLHNVLPYVWPLGSFKDFCCIDHVLFGQIIVSFLVIRFNFSYVTTNIKWSSLRFLTVERIGWDNTLCLTWFQLQYDSVHSEYRTVFTSAREKLLTTDSTSNDIAHKRIALGQICCEIHLLPFISFFDSEAREAKIWPNRVCTNKINLSI
jgi:hypothetical protein